MPELPEVETIARELRRVLPGATFTAVSVAWQPIVHSSPLDVVNELPGQRIEHIKRRGKYLLFSLSTGNVLLIHLKMSGRLVVCCAAAPADAYGRVTLDLDDGRQLRLRDPRKFARVHLTSDATTVLDRLGPEPLAENFTEQDFASRFQGRRAMIKPLLLDQTFIAGVGNIYADESLFLARIQPCRRVETLSEGEKRRLYRAVRRVLTSAIALNGSTLRDGMFEGGGFQDIFRVYSREQQPCPRCGTAIERIRLGQRSAHFCPRCQS